LKPNIGMLGVPTQEHLILEPDRLHEGPDIMVAVRAAIEHAEDEIDLGWGGNSDERTKH
jgi:hypothetical protein